MCPYTTSLGRPLADPASGMASDSTHGRVGMASDSTRGRVGMASDSTRGRVGMARFYECLGNSTLFSKNC